MIAVQQICVECLNTPENANLRDFQNNLLCAACAARYYVQCAVCSLYAAKDEVAANESAAEFRCPNCFSERQTEMSFVADEEIVAGLVTEYLRLHAEEKSIKDRLEAVKEQLKQIADVQTQNGAPVTFEAAEGAVKCSYRTALKVVPEAVSALRGQLDAEIFNRLFAEKISFDVSKDFDKILSSELPNDLKQQLENAVKRTESATLTVVKK